jgi:hypothetical protein
MRYTIGGLNLMAISPLPTIPSRQQPEATFATNGDNFLGALPTFVTEANALAADVNSKESTVSSAAATATTKAGEALASANAAAASASEASGFADAADTSAGQAAGSAADAADSFVDMDKRYLGGKATAPSVDNQGQPLQSGAVYFNTTTGKVMTWNGSAWVEGLSAVAGVSSFNGATGAVTGVASFNGATGAVTGVASVNGATGAITGIQKETAPKYTVDADGTVSGTWAIDYANGPVISATAGGNITAITISNFPASGSAGHLRLMLSIGAYAVTFPAWKWIKSDLTTTTTFGDLELTLPTDSPTIIDLFTVDGGTNVYAAIVRN